MQLHCIEAAAAPQRLDFRERCIPSLDVVGAKACRHPGGRCIPSLGVACHNACACEAAPAEKIYYAWSAYSFTSSIITSTLLSMASAVICS